MTRKLILVVEDSQSDARLILKFLSKQGFKDDVQRVADGEEALNFVFRRGNYSHSQAVPDLIMLDLGLPKVSGYEVLKEIKTTSGVCTIPVVVLSTSAHPEDIRCMREIGAREYFTKPFDIREFEQIIGRILAELV